MFDIGFGELLLVMVIGLVVLGPERLPVAVKTVAGWIRALRSLAANVQNELAQELKLQELQDSLKKMEEKAGMQSLSPELKASMEELKDAAESLKNSYQLKPDEMRELEEDETHFHSSVSPSAVSPSSIKHQIPEEAVSERSIQEQPVQEPSIPEQQKKKSPEQANGEH
ncbi:Involved in membrane translocation of periplasmic proteins that preserves folded structures and bound ligands [Xenorhabdus nematophila ATCC 19061]|uniref:Sec-independent protein translocase protein TatB n=1 Tax=Xenorhabdus nematophila (strain ATCC 19061 / DSM 3370 / CCUG 14189 / LMG 1036 / NCIMB 9965 / AN6) TaxID=406817 RepID=D3VBS1_XENNA|nr:Sec-independent protein translocase protein TatB [Xenorhabdus nematophila]CBJ91910.1 Involved in membrane translocation of periplasmic proteins that preserves folded structures and bound ligands [Xenorhabdus nematophila ATCC 19061]CEE90644.1 Involved in membrane translocation of periplasmic proteins that preserves folded structures and bound ligands [Xenorhabdus nematophila str. Anatoliense]CEE92957.1 Involved in membrane translocation of periplasmic proteins that preserves folded structures 